MVLIKTLKTPGARSDALAGTRERRSAHDPGRVIQDVAVMLANGGDCVTDMDAYRGRERLFGAAAPETTGGPDPIEQQPIDRLDHPVRQGDGALAGVGSGGSTGDEPRKFGSPVELGVTHR